MMDGLSSDCDLPDGWLMSVKTRKGGATYGRIDVYYRSPPPDKLIFRSKVRLQEYFGTTFDLTGFTYCKGKFEEAKIGEMKDGSAKKKGRAENRRKTAPGKVFLNNFDADSSEGNLPRRSGRPKAVKVDQPSKHVDADSWEGNLPRRQERPKTVKVDHGPKLLDDDSSQGNLPRRPGRPKTVKVDHGPKLLDNDSSQGHLPRRSGRPKAVKVEQLSKPFDDDSSEGNLPRRLGRSKAIKDDQTEKPVVVEMEDGSAPAKKKGRKLDLLKSAKCPKSTNGAVKRRCRLECGKRSKDTTEGKTILGKRGSGRPNIVKFEQSSKPFDADSSEGNLPRRQGRPKAVKVDQTEKPVVVHLPQQQLDSLNVKETTFTAPIPSDRINNLIRRSQRATKPVCSFKIYETDPTPGHPKKSSNNDEQPKPPRGRPRKSLDLSKSQVSPAPTTRKRNSRGTAADLTNAGETKLEELMATAQISKTPLSEPVVTKAKTPLAASVVTKARTSSSAQMETNTRIPPTTASNHGERCPTKAGTSETSQQQKAGKTSQATGSSRDKSKDAAPPVGEITPAIEVGSVQPSDEADSGTVGGRCRSVRRLADAYQPNASDDESCSSAKRSRRHVHTPTTAAENNPATTSSLKRWRRVDVSAPDVEQPTEPVEKRRKSTVVDSTKTALEISLQHDAAEADGQNKKSSSVYELPWNRMPEDGAELIDQIFKGAKIRNDPRARESILRLHGSVLNTILDRCKRQVAEARKNGVKKDDHPLSEQQMAATLRKTRKNILNIVKPHNFKPVFLRRPRRIKVADLDR